MLEATYHCERLVVSLAMLPSHAGEPSIITCPPAFAVNPHPTEEQRRALGERIGLDEKQVAVGVVDLFLMLGFVRVDLVAFYLSIARTYQQNASEIAAIWDLFLQSWFGSRRRKDKQVDDPKGADAGATPTASAPSSMVSPSSAGLVNAAASAAQTPGAVQPAAAPAEARLVPPGGGAPAPVAATPPLAPAAITTPTPVLAPAPAPIKAAPGVAPQPVLLQQQAQPVQQQALLQQQQQAILQQQQHALLRQQQLIQQQAVQRQQQQQALLQRQPHNQQAAPQGEAQLTPQQVEEYAQLLEAAKAALETPFREDGPPLAFDFDDTRDATNALKRKEPGGVGIGSCCVWRSVAVLFDVFGVASTGLFSVCVCVCVKGSQS